MRKFLLAMMIAGSVHAGQLCDGFAPENDLWIGTQDRNVSPVTQNQFNKVLDRISDIYSPIFSSMGKELIIQKDWSNGTVNAFAYQSGDQWFISMYGGLARHEKVTLDGFALVACHEIGHHLGGAPKKWEGSWASNEGQSDYFSTTKCFRTYLEIEDNISIVKAMDIPDLVTQQCESVFSNASEIAICQRSSMAGLSLANMLSALSQGNDTNFEATSTNVVAKTLNYHPQAQCRLDTYFQGALCDKDHNKSLDDQDANINACTRSEGYQLGVRPLCWFKP